MPLAHFHKFSSKYDVEKLKSEYFHVIENFSLQKQHDKYHDGGWKSAPLYSHNGDPFNDLPKGQPYSPTPLIKFAPYTHEIIKSFNLVPERIRYLSLSPNSRIKWHCDKNESFYFGSIRMHIPIITNDDVIFRILNSTLRMKEGELWYGDFTFPHQVINNSNSSRIHLVMDFEFDLDSQKENIFFSEFLKVNIPFLKAKSLVSSSCWRFINKLNILN